MLDSFAGTLRYVARHWPAYLFGVGGAALLMMLLTLLAAQQGWWFLIPFILAILLLLFYFAGVSLWAAHERYDTPNGRVADRLYRLGQLTPEDKIACLDYGERRTALDLVRHLTTGHLYVIDIYEPALMPGGVVSRLRHQAPAQRPDPRLTWLTGRVGLLPLPDASVWAVVLNEVMGQLTHPEERAQLLAEIYRVLQPRGRLLMAERVRSDSNGLVLGPLVWALSSAADWRTQIERAGFRWEGEENQKGLIHFFRADKVAKGNGRQLPFAWGEPLGS